MGTVVVTRNMVGCDGCGAVYGLPEGYGSPMEARAAAYADGWRYPNQVTKTGAAIKAVSDVCPACVDGWVPALRGARLRVLKRADVDRQETKP